MNNPYLSALFKAGQSIWYDGISKNLLEEGILQSLINEGVRGLTSNPTIFMQAVSEDARYQEKIKNLKKEGLNSHQICEKIMIEDVGKAADLLTDVYQSSNGKDGFASIEVNPHFAYDAEATINSAKKIWLSLNKPNIMVKVPATKEGLVAIETLISEGINVNVTLIFSVKRYKEVINAYLNGLMKASGDMPLSQINSVASFFVSRLDAIVEKTFDSLIAENKATTADKDKFTGKIAIANTKLAYNLFKEEFSDSSALFPDLKHHGANLQRPLWASTGPKNPNFSPTIYVEALVGKNTVNTLPPKTLHYLMENGAEIKENMIETDIEEAKLTLNELANYGINLKELLNTLEKEGVDKFTKSYNELITTIEQV